VTFIKNFTSPPMVYHREAGTTALFESAKPSVLKSIKQSRPTMELRCVIGRDLFHRGPARIEAGDVIEFG